MKNDELTVTSVRRLREFVHVVLPRDDGLVICPWLHGAEESATSIPLLWGHEAERIVLRDLREGLEAALEEDGGDLRLAMTRGRALILFDWIIGEDSSGAWAPLISQGSPEQHVLLTLEGQLEQEMVFEIGGAVQGTGPNGGASWPGFEAIIAASRQQVLEDELRRH